MNDKQRFHDWMRDGLDMHIAGSHEQSFSAFEYAWKIAKYTRTGTPRQGDAWERRAQWSSACWIAAQRLSGGTRDTQEET